MRKRFKNYVSALLVFILVLSGVTGCSGKNAVYEETVTGADASENMVNYDTAYDLQDNGTDAGDAITYGDEVAEGESAYGTEAADQLDETEYKMAVNDEVNEIEEYDMEEYNAIVENDFQSVYNNPLSTFSIDVDTASYSNIRRMINDNQSVKPEAVRLEEMINYFSYDYKEPKSGEPFSVNTELSDCPWNENSKLLLIGLKAKDIDLSERPRSNLVFLLDVSGSMEDADKLPLMQKAFILLLENLNENDRISIVTYAGEERVVLSGARGDETTEITSAIEDLTAGGSTAGSAGIEKAYELADKYFIEGGNNRVILATDGDLNVGITSEGALTRLVEKKRKDGVFLSVLGFGSENIKDNKMEAMADNGNGNYYYIDSILEAEKVLVEEMGGTLYTIAKDVKLQVEFNPANIKGYRLIGYENRKLNAEDFKDDTKDAGEIGAGHRVTALYEILTNDSKQEVPESDLKYQSQKASTNSKEWLTVNIRYKEPEGEKSKLLSVPVDGSIYTEEMPDNLNFASAVASFGMLLRDSKWKGTSSYESILNQLKNLDISEDEYKMEFKSLVKKMQNIQELSE